MAILKNRVYRLGIIFLALTLLTVGMVGNTLAKYVTKYTGNDPARVAQWGVKVNGQLSHELVENEFNLFNKVYDGDEYEMVNGELELIKSDRSVVSVNDDYVFAPGTKGEMEITVSGKPETAFEFHFDLGLAYEGSWVYLNNNTRYEPIVFRLYRSADGGVTKNYFTGGGNAEKGITLAALGILMTDIEKGSIANANVEDHIADSSYYAPNTEIRDILNISENDKVYVSWEWPFVSGGLVEGSTTDYVNDPKDTFLGDIAATCITTGEGSINVPTIQIVNEEEVIVDVPLDVEMPNIKVNAALGATQLDRYPPDPEPPVEP